MVRFRNILVYLREGSRLDAGLDRAVDLARSHEAPLTLVHVLERIPDHVGGLIPGDWDLREMGMDEARKKLGEIAGPLRESGVDVTTDVLEGRPAIEITRRVLRCGHDLVMKTAENEESLLGTTAHRLMRICPCPVWIVHPDQKRPYQRLLAAIHPATGDSGGHRLQQKILEFAVSLREINAMKLDVVHVWRAHGEEFLSGRMKSRDLTLFLASLRQDADRRMATFLKDAGANIPPDGVHLRRGPPEQVILDVARQVHAELLVLGTIARGGLSGFLIGNTAERILHRAECSILAIKPDGFVSPVKS